MTRALQAVAAHCRGRARTALLPCTLALASAAAAGCGAGGKAPAPVASVQGGAISAAALAHWETVKRHEAGAATSGGAAPARQLRDAALAFLITAAWLEREAAARGIRVPPGQAEASYEQLANGPAAQTFKEVLARRGLTRDDELRVLRLDELATKLKAAIAARHPGAKPGQLARYTAAFEAAYRSRWRQLTVCRAGYAIPECGRVRGAAAPSG